MFRGLNKLTLDAKGRLAIPTKYRDDLQAHCNAELVITIDPQQRCLLFYPKPDWLEIEQKLMQLPNIDKNVRKMQRLYVGHATEIDMDSQGRVLLPPPLREFGQLKKHAVMLGQGMKLELWDETYWVEQRDGWLTDFEQSPEDMSSGMEGITI